ncbi:MAG TPA: hypothetical protein VLG74_11385 [Blastocatellia bacterium]|nr:hypothetical protein [Blastocatellia bacterium]
MRRLLDAARTGRHGVRDFAMMLLVMLAALLGHSRLTMVSDTLTQARNTSLKL